MVKRKHSDQFFIDSFGAIHKLKNSMKNASEIVFVHHEIAKRIVDKKIENPQKYLENLGWIVVGSSSGGNYILKEPTQAQLNTLIKCGYRYLDIIDKCRIDLKTMERVDKYGITIK